MKCLPCSKLFMWLDLFSSHFNTLSISTLSMRLEDREGDWLKLTQLARCICTQAPWPQSPPPSHHVNLQNLDMFIPSDPVRSLPKVCPEDVIRDNSLSAQRCSL